MNRQCLYIYMLFFCSGRAWHDTFIFEEEGWPWWWVCISRGESFTPMMASLNQIQTIYVDNHTCFLMCGGRVYVSCTAGYRRKILPACLPFWNRLNLCDKLLFSTSSWSAPIREVCVWCRLANWHWDRFPITGGWSFDRPTDVTEKESAAAPHLPLFAPPPNPLCTSILPFFYFTLKTAFHLCLDLYSSVVGWTLLLLLEESCLDVYWTVTSHEPTPQPGSPMCMCTWRCSTAFSTQHDDLIVFNGDGTQTTIHTDFALVKSLERHRKRIREKFNFTTQDLVFALLIALRTGEGSKMDSLFYS